MSLRKLNLLNKKSLQLILLVLMAVLFGVTKAEQKDSTKVYTTFLKPKRNFVSYEIGGSLNRVSFGKYYGIKRGKVKTFYAGVTPLILAPLPSFHIGGGFEYLAGKNIGLFANMEFESFAFVYAIQNLGTIKGKQPFKSIRQSDYFLILSNNYTLGFNFYCKRFVFTPLFIRAVLGFSGKYKNIPDLNYAVNGFNDDQIFFATFGANIKYRF
jgi:hypothetical protein